MQLPLIMMMIMMMTLTNKLTTVSATDLPSCSISENAPPLSFICDLSHILPPTMQQPALDNFQNFFRLAGTQLMLTQSLDREQLIESASCQITKSPMYSSDSEQCQLMLEVSGKGPTFHQVGVLITDVNDNSPSFDRMTFVFSVPENSLPNTERELPQATDPDRGRNGTVTYKLQQSDSYSTRFLLVNVNHRQPSHMEPLKLKILRPFDREKEEKFRLILIAKDLGTPSRSGSLTIEIDVTDVNDHVPQFNQSTYRFSVSESLLPGQPLGRVAATDQDVSSRLSIHLAPSASSEVSDTFSVAPDGVITSKVQLDYTLPSEEYRIPVIAVDGGVPPLSASATVLLHVSDVNNHHPVIEVTPPSYRPTSSLPSLIVQRRQFSVLENCPPNTYVAKVTVTDLDYGVNAEVDCSLTDQPGSVGSSRSNNNLNSASSLFSLQPIKQVGSSALGSGSRSGGTSGGANRRAGRRGRRRRYYFQLMTAPTAQFDREQAEHHQVHIVCRDSGEQPTGALISTRALLVIVRDQNDNPPVFSKSFIAAKVRENSPVGVNVIRLMAHDADQGENAQTRYELLPDKLGAHNFFQLDSVSGVISTQRQLDRETHPKFILKASAFDKKKPIKMRNNVTVHVQVEDENDNAPQFDEAHLEFRIRENRGGLVGRITGRDADEGRNGQFEFYLITRTSTFQVTRSGEILVRNKADIDREKHPKFILEVGSRDHGSPRRSSSAAVVIVVEDINDNSPQFVRPKPGQFCNISIDWQPGSRVFEVLAEDADEGDNARIDYSLILPTMTTAPLFSINRTDGSLYLERALSLTSSSSLSSVRSLSRLVLVAVDRGVPSRSSTATLRLRYYGDNGAAGTGVADNGDSILAVPVFPDNIDANGKFDGGKFGRPGAGGSGGNGGGSYGNGQGRDGARAGSGRGSTGGRSSSSRDLVLSVGIGMVLLIFVFLLLLVSYFCVSVLLQRQRRSRARRLTKTDGTMADEKERESDVHSANFKWKHRWGLGWLTCSGSSEAADVKRMRNDRDPIVSFPNCWWWRWHQRSNFGENREHQGQQQQQQHQQLSQKQHQIQFHSEAPSSATIVHSNAAGLPMCINTWDRQGTLSSSEVRGTPGDIPQSPEIARDTSLYASYREFGGPATTPAPVPAPIVLNPYWQYSTLGASNTLQHSKYTPNHHHHMQQSQQNHQHPQFRTLHKHQTLPPGITFGSGVSELPGGLGAVGAGDSNSSDEINRIFYGVTAANEKSIPLLQQHQQQLTRSLSPSTVVAGGMPQYAGYVVGTPRIANSFV